MNSKIKKDKKNGLFGLRYDIAISVNGKDVVAQQTAEEIANLLSHKGFRVFYYRDEKEASLLLGTALDLSLKNVYSSNSKLVIVIASENYGIAGYTQKEWDWIKMRTKEFPTENFLVPLVMDEEKTPKEICDYGFKTYDENPFEILREVRQRLGQWSLIKAWLYFLVPLALLSWLTYNYLTIDKTDQLANAILITSFAVSGIWWIVFWLIPKLRPPIIYRPSVTFHGLHRLLYVNTVLEKVGFTVILALIGLTIVLLPSKLEQIAHFQKGWLDQSNVTGSLHYFSDMVKTDEMLSVWLPIVIDNNYEPYIRGRSFDLIYKCLKDDYFTQKITKLIPFSEILREFNDNNNIVKDSDNIHNVLVGVDLNKVETLDHIDLSSMSFVGNEHPLGSTPMKQSTLSGCYFYNYDVTNADLR